MKKYNFIALLCLFVFGMTACGGTQQETASAARQASQESLPEIAVSESESKPQESVSVSSPDIVDDAENKTLIVYFSQTGTTEVVAEEIQSQTGGDIFEILPATPYPNDYNTLLDMAKTEQDNNARPAFTGQVERFAEYDTVFLGYPIWHGSCPMIVLAFLEEYDCSGKTILPFCTSGSTGIARSVDDIRAICADSTVQDGLGLSGSAASSPQSAVKAWVDSLALPPLPEDANSTPDALEEHADRIQLQIGEKFFTATLVDNSSAQAFRELLAEGPLTLDMRDYGEMEKVSELAISLPTNDEPITTAPGDLMLYQGNSFVLYYAPNSWNLTRLGRINDVSAEELKETLGDGSVTVTLSLV